MLSKDRLEESCKMITAHLVKVHKDKDENSLFCRFGEIQQYIEDLEITSRALESTLTRIDLKSLPPERMLDRYWPSESEIFRQAERIESTFKTSEEK